MVDISEKALEFNQVWNDAYEQLSHNTGGGSVDNLDAVNVAVMTAVEWLKRKRAPSGHSSGFKVAKSMCELMLYQLIELAQQISGNQPHLMQSFQASLISLINSIHTMGILSSNIDKGTISKDLTLQLTESVQQIELAESELTRKTEAMKDAENLYDKITEFHDYIERSETEITTKFHSAESSLDEIENKKNETEELVTNINDIHEKITALQNTMTENKQELDDLIVTAQKQNSVIESILPSAASAGLAAAFSSRIKQLTSAKYIWLSVFVIALLGLAYSASHILLVTVSMSKPWQEILYRVPIALPLVWMAWFSAIQYGNNSRLLEDYAFKKATSMAFEGYRDHMKYLSNINTDEGYSAMQLLAESTISVLRNEPLRIFGKASSDASPAFSIAETFSKRGE
jgi:hypothetical protein